MVSKEHKKMFSNFNKEEGELIPILQDMQQRDGYISEKAVKEISRFLKISENQIFGVASFYTQFRFNAPGRNSIKVCLGTACHVQGGEILSRSVERELGVSHGQTTDDKKFDFQRVACLGCCALAPVVQVNDDIYSKVTVLGLKEILERYE
ncbi:NADH-quinone oxidoreductase subunit NuoE [candidate division KSB1 bacterium]